MVSNQKLLWTPNNDNIGPHDIKIIATDGLSSTEQKFILYVNDTPSIITVDSISVKLGDTLKHILTAKDLNKKTNLTYSIQSTLEDMMLNASTGAITWKPQKEDLGNHLIEASVSDGFDSTEPGKKIKITASISSPTFTKSCALLKCVDQLISETWIKPSTPSATSINAP